MTKSKKSRFNTTENKSYLFSKLYCRFRVIWIKNTFQDFKHKENQLLSTVLDGLLVHAWKRGTNIKTILKFILPLCLLKQPMLSRYHDPQRQQLPKKHLGYHLEKEKGSINKQVSKREIQRSHTKFLCWFISLPYTKHCATNLHLAYTFSIFSGAMYSPCANLKIFFFLQ